MTIKINQPLLWMGTLALSAVAFAGPKTYGVTLHSSMKAGEAQLASGEYKVKIDGADAVFTDAQTGKSFSVPVKVESNEKKYAATAVDSITDGETQQLKAIELGGSTIKLEFAQ